jgi:translocation and assembly module TamB
MLARLLKTAFTAVLFYTMLTAQAASISISSSVDKVSYDLGFMQFSLENIGSSMRISPTAEGKLLVEDIHAKRLLITLVQDSPPATAGSGLPDRINLPFSIRIRSARIAEVIILDGEQRHTLTDVAFNLDANNRQIQLELVHAGTPWGTLSSQLSMNNARPFALDGKLFLEKSDTAQTYDLELDIAGDLQQLQFSSNALLTRVGKQTAILHEHSKITSSTMLGRIAINGHLGLNDQLPLDVRARFTELAPLFSSADLSGNGHDRLDADLLLQGQLAPQADLRISFSTVNSVWQNAPLNLQANARLLGQAVEQIELNATLKDNRLQAHGSMGKPDSTLSWQAGLDDLSAFRQSLSGRLNAQGKLAGPFDNLALNMEWLAEQLSMNSDIQIEKLSGKATLSNAQDTPLTMEMHAENFSLAGNAPFNANLSLAGSQAQHQIELKTTETKQSANPSRLHVLINGSIAESGLWQGQLEKLSYQGDKPVEMQGKAQLQYGTELGFSLEKLALRFASGYLHIDQLQNGKGQLTTQGRLDKLDLATLPQLLFTLPANMTGNPVFSGNWDIKADDDANGRADIRLVGGDIGIITADGSIRQLEMNELTASLLLEKNRASLSGQGTGKVLGELRFALATQLEPSTSGFLLNRHAPLEVSVDARLKSLIWLPLLESMMGTVIDGQVNMALQGKGTIAQPALTGTLQGQSLTLSVPGEGVNLNNGVLDASFSNDQLLIRQARFEGGNGFLTTSGSLSLQGGAPKLALQWHAENFTAVSRTDRMMIIEGDLDTRLNGKLMEVSGEVEITRGLIELAGEDKPTLGDDVVIIGVEAEVTEHPLVMQVSNLQIGIGNKSGSLFVLRGRGLDSSLKGSITLNGRTDQSLRAEGTINAAGTYMAYGQVLNIERGQLVFIGPVNNPGLNILALRQNLAVRAGVEIHGTVLNPAVKLVSIPEVSDSDKLAWLVLGHGMDRAGQDQFAMLSLAAGALLSQGQSVPLQTRLARAAGLDTFHVGGSDAESASVSLGKRLAPNLYLSYEKEVTGLLNVARLTYDLTSNWSVRTQAGSESAVDVLYTFSFK